MSDLTLSNIQSLPYFVLKLPISGINIQYRQMMVREEKIFLLVDDESSINKTNAILQVINNCTKSEDDNYIIKDLCTADIECIILNIRIKSNGEQCSIIRTCQKCKTDYDKSFPLKDYTIINDKKDSVMNFGSFGVTLRDLSISDSEFIEDIVDENMREIDLIEQLMKKSIKTVFTDDSVYPVDQYSEDDLDGFINNLTDHQFKKIHDFVVKQPEIIYRIKSKCVHCGKSDDFELSSITTFLD